MTEQIPDDEFLRRYWKSQGGGFHGPNVEHGYMPEAKLLPLLRRLLDMGDPPTDETSDWPPRFRVDPIGGVKLLLALVRDGHRSLEEVAPFLAIKLDPAQEPHAGDSASPHSTEDDFQHWLSYTGRYKGHEYETELRAAYFAGAGAPVEPK